jgi:hypothetical protein
MEDATKATSYPTEGHPDDSEVRPPGSKVPIIAFTLRPLALPFRHPLLLIKLGMLPFLLSVSFGMVSNIFWPTGLVASHRLGLVMLGLKVAYVPFAVGWTRLVIQGPSAITDRSAYRFGRTELRFLSAIALFGSTSVIIAILAYMVRLASHSFHYDLQMAAGLLLLWTLGAIAVCIIRLQLMFPAIAIDKYPGLAASWKQTQGYFETIALLNTTVRVPYLLIILLLDGLVEPYSPFILKAAIITGQCMVYLLSEASVVGMLALVYERLAPTLPM